MKPHVAEIVERLIWDYRLHDDLEGPVPIFRLEPLFPVTRQNLDHTGLAGTIVLPATLPVSESNFARVILSDALDDHDERIIYAHEVAHGILGHEGGLQLDAMDQWFEDRSEREAWEVAARLLVPPVAWLDRGDVQRMAAAFAVPPALVRRSYS